MRSGTILQSENDGGRSIFDVKLDGPFLIELSKLFVVKECGTVDGSQRWRRTMDHRYSLEMSIDCLDSDDADQLLLRLDAAPLVPTSHAVQSQCVLRTLWDELPECPLEGRTLPLACVTNHETLNLAHRIELSMGWTHPESPIVQYNRGLKDLSRARQLPTPSASDDLEKLPGKWTIKYKFRDGFQIRELTKTSLECVHCGTGVEHSSFTRLYLHYTTDHQSWEYQAEGTDWIQSSGMTVVLWIQDAEIPVNTDSMRERNINWIAPSCPVDVAAHICGDGPWNHPAHNKHRSPLKRPGRTMRRENSATSAPRPANATVTGRSKGKRHAPGEVKNLPLRTRRTYPVPNMPGITFFRTTSKQAVRRGDELPESDDEIDDYWFTQRQRRDLMRLGGHTIVRKFHELFYVHINEERPSSDMHMQDAVVRFARKYLNESANPKWADAMRAKLSQMENGRVITSATAKYCLSLLRTGSGTTSLQEWPVSVHDRAPGDEPSFPEQTTSPEHSRHSPSRRETIAESPMSERSDHVGLPDASGNDVWVGNRTRWVAGRMTSTAQNDRDGGDDSSVTVDLPLKGPTQGLRRNKQLAATRMHPSGSHNTCLCGQIVAGLRGTMGCSRPGCPRAFHLKCLDLPKRVSNWRCQDCTSKSRMSIE
jgi:hypothetical protein